MNGGAEEADGSQNRRTHDRQAEIWACLQGVMDPELDESVTDLNFVTKADVDSENRVHIEFRLPTYWCAANFSFLMADDMRRVVSALDWVKGVSVVLGEHMYADKINRGISQGLSFQEAFGNEATGDLSEVRRTFLLKAFQRRQEALYEGDVGLLFAVILPREADVPRKNIVGAEAGRGVHHLFQAEPEQAGAGEEDEREGDLCHDEDAP